MSARTPLDGEHAGATFRDLVAIDAVVARGSFERCRFEGCTLTAATFTSAHFSDCVFTGCELSRVGLAGADLTHVRFVDCRAMGVNWTEVNTRTFAATFERCRLDSSLFGGMKLKGFSWVECLLRNVDFTGCDLTNTRFSGSDLGGALVRHAVVKGADFSGATDFHFDTRTNKAGKTKVSLEVALAALAELGLVVPELGGR